MNNAKNVLRKQLRKEYKEQKIEERKSIDVMLKDQLIEQDVFQKCTRIFIYASVDYEVDTREIIDYAFHSGRIVALPKCRTKGQMDFYRYTGELMDGKFSIPEPTGNEVLFPEETDIMIVPGLAFAPDGYRIGQGGGYYDRYLEKHSCTCIGLCRSRFLLNNIPVEWNDLPMDCVITENTVYLCKNGAS